MTDVGSINVTLQLFGSILSLMIILCLFLGGDYDCITSATELRSTGKP